VGAHAQRDVFIETGDFFDAHARAGLDFVAGDDGADVDLAQAHGDTEIAEDAQEVFRVLLVLFAAVPRGVGDLLAEERDVGEAVVFVRALRRGERGFFKLLGLHDIERERSCGGRVPRSFAPSLARLGRGACCRGCTALVAVGARGRARLGRRSDGSADLGRDVRAAFFFGGLRVVASRPLRQACRILL